MDASTSRGRSRITRAVAWLLLVASLLQSAAQAGRGCLPRAIGAPCCCAASGGEAAPTRTPEVRSCCARAEAAAPTEGPRFERPRACTCESPLAAVPTPAPQPSGGGIERALVELADSQAFALQAACEPAFVSLVEARALDRPPDRGGLRACSPVQQRLRARGVMAGLVELGVLLR